MAPRDAEKNAFKTPIKNFYYIVMPFGLKNAGTTYQHTMIIILHNIMHHKMEDYVDNIVVKLRKREDHVKVLRTVFERCRLFKLRMNPLKCTFVVSARKFLRFQVHNSGIDIDPAKEIAITTIKPPATVKELKSFLGKVSYIRRFILELAPIPLAFTKLLKKGQSF